MEQPQTHPLTIAILSASADAPLRLEFEQHLQPLIRKFNLTLWNTEKIPAGSDWQQECHTALERASLILLMISHAFLSDDSLDQMMQYACACATSNLVSVVPLLLRPVFYEEHKSLIGLQCLPRQKPVFITQWRDKNEAFLHIIRELDIMFDTLPSISNTTAMRQNYLQQLIERYSTVTLPLKMQSGFSLQTIYQPLALLSDPLAAEDLEKRQRRKFLDEPFETHTPHSKDQKPAAQPVTAEHGEDAVAKSPQGRLVILGGPGTGKTTTLKHLTSIQAQRALTDPTAFLPIFLSLADLAHSGKKDLQSYLPDILKEMHIEESYAVTLWEEIEHGRAFVVLDSLDEIIPIQRSHIINLINTLAARHGNIWLIGSRFTDYKGGQLRREQFKEWELLPMTTPLRQELASKLFPQLKPQSLLPSPSPTTFVALLEEHPHAAAWGDNPLLFSLAAVVFLQTENLPTSRVSLYHDVIEAVLTLREENKFNRKNLLLDLMGFSLWLYQEKKGRTFTLEDLLIYLRKNQQHPRDNYNLIAQKIVSSGLLDIVAQETYGFRHLTFQEYLASAELARLLVETGPTQEFAWNFAWSKHTYSRWTEILRLMVGNLTHYRNKKGYRTALLWLNQLINQSTTMEGDPGDLGFVLALASLAEIPDDIAWKEEKAALLQLEYRLISLWIANLLAAARGRREARITRFQKLSEDVISLHPSNPNTLIQPLLVALKDNDNDVHHMAANTLVRINAWIEIEGLLPLLNDPSSFVRETVLRVLDVKYEYVDINVILPYMKDESPLVILRSLSILVHKYENIDIEVFLNLIDCRDFSIMESTLDLLEVQMRRLKIESILPLLNDPSSLVREAAVKVLGAQGDRVKIKSLLPLLQDPYANVRLAALRALWAKEEYLEPERLVPLLDDPDSHVKAAVVKVLGVYGECVEIERLLPLIDKDDWCVREAVVEVLSTRGECVEPESLLPLLNDPSSLVREAAVKVLGAQGDRVKIEWLLFPLNTRSSSLRQAVVKALGAQGDRVELEKLLFLLNDTDADVRAEVVKVLGTRGEHVNIERLLPLLNDPDWQVRVAIVEMLGAQGERIELERLLTLLSIPSSSVRTAALEVLGAQGEEVELEKLLPLLDDPDEDVRAAAVKVLGIQEEPVEIARLLPLLNDPFSSVRVAAVRVLGAQGKGVELEKLLPLLNDPEVYVSETVVEVLQEKVNELELEKLLRLLKNDHWNVREAVVRILGALGENLDIEELLPLLFDPSWSVRKVVVKVLGEQRDRLELEWWLFLLEDPDFSVRTIAVEVLVGQKEHIELERLLSLLEDSNSNVRESVVKVLGAQGKHVELEKLLPLLKDPDSHVREAVVRVLEAKEDYLEPKMLFSLLDDPDSHVKAAVVKALGVYGECVDIERLLPLIDTDDWYVREAVVEVLSTRGECVKPESLLPLLNSTDENVRVAVVKVLGAQGERVELEKLLPLLDDLDRHVREAVARALGAQEECVELEKLLPLLNDREFSVKAAVVEVLISRKNPIPTNLLLPFLYHEKDDMRQYTIEIAEIRNELLPPELLIDLCADENRAIRQLALKILQKQFPHLLPDLVPQAHALLDGHMLGNVFPTLIQMRVADTLGELNLAFPPLLDKLTTLLDWPHWQVRIKAAEALGKIRRNIPDLAIQRLLAMRQDPRPYLSAVREAADDALAEILSLETGIEDDE